MKNESINHFVNNDENLDFMIPKKGTKHILEMYVNSDEGISEQKKTQIKTILPYMDSDGKIDIIKLSADKVSLNIADIQDAIAQAQKDSKEKIKKITNSKIKERIISGCFSAI